MRSNKDDLVFLARFLDSQFRLPFGLRVGWDGILGIIPGVGDVISSSLSFYVLVRAAGLGTPPWVLARMVLNVLFDTAIGAVPIVGDVADFFWQANNRNLRLLERMEAEGARVESSSKWMVISMVCVMLTFAVFTVVGAFLAARIAWQWMHELLIQSGIIS